MATTTASAAPTTYDTASTSEPTVTKNTLAPVISKTESAKAEAHYVTGIRLFLLVASVSLITFLFLLDQSILSTAIPKITSQFHSLPDIGWYTGVYQLAA